MRAAERAVPKRIQRHDQVKCHEAVDNRIREKHPCGEDIHSPLAPLDLCLFSLPSLGQPAAKPLPWPEASLEKEANVRADCVVDEEQAQHGHGPDAETAADEDESKVKPRPSVRIQFADLVKEQIQPKVERQKQHETHRQKNGHSLGQATDGWSPLSTHHVVGGGEDHRTLGQRTPEEEVHQIDLPGSPWVE
jgi:hypothetical protein